MSLNSFIDMPDVREAMKPLRPPPPRKLGVPIKVPPMSDRYGLVGTAFDYLLRFDLQRRAPHARCEPWVAEQVPNKILTEFGGGSAMLGLDLWDVAHCDAFERAKKLKNRVLAQLADAKVALAKFLKSRSPRRAALRDMAVHATRLAKIDTIRRVRKIDQDFGRNDAQHVDELLDLLEIVPFPKLLHPKLMLLNPTFGEGSVIVCGADADLIAGDMLLDLKTSKKPDQQTKQLDTILGYYLLARHQRRVDRGFPVIKRLAIYYARYGYLWCAHAVHWTNHPDFLSIEEWFFRRADEVFGRMNGRLPVAKKKPRKKTASARRE